MKNSSRIKYSHRTYDTAVYIKVRGKSMSTDKKYKISVVMAVYNVGEYIREAVDSIIAQSIGFNNIEIIMIDDGSTDDSGEICDEYKRLYPDNILVIHKDNEGAARARRDGVKHATGELVSFVDPDDIVTSMSFEAAYSFFKKHEGEIDVISIPITFFGDLSGAHPLNNKFKRGTRVINLLTDWQSAQMSLASAFLTLDAARGIDADEHLATSEDAKELAKILLRKMKMGVVKEAEYKYRKRKTSLVGTAKNKPEWYNVYLEHYTKWVIDYSKATVGYLPKFIQYTLMYDLQWRFRPQKIQNDILTEYEKEIYKDKLFSLAEHFDTDVIMAQSSLYIDHKLYLLYRAHNLPPEIASTMDKRSHYYTYDNLLLFRQNELLCSLHFIKIDRERLTVEGTQTYPSIGIEEPEITARLGNREYPAEYTRYDDIIYSSEVEIGKRIGFRVEIPLKNITDKRQKLELILTVNGKRSVQTRVIYGKYMPITKKYSRSYYAKDGILILGSDNGFSVARAAKKQIRMQEKNFLTDLKNTKAKAAKKARIARALVKLVKKILPRDIWLIADKSDRADDNGEVFFTYLTKNWKDVKCHPVFAISKSSVDYERLKSIGTVVPYMSWRHKLLHLVAEHTISAYSHDEISSPFLENSFYYGDLLQDNEVIFIQHGVIKDDLSRGVNKRHKNFKMFVTSAERERQSILDYNYGYTEDEVVLTGLPRYDLLYDAPQKKITIMPTWQRKLFGSYDARSSHWELLPGFTESGYYEFYNSLINSDRLLVTAEKYGYEIQFMPHPIFFPYIDLFKTDGRTKILDPKTRYRDIFAESSLIITDYSSVAFDFAYLRKPIVYTRFEENHYENGYFDYEHDGFGEVEWGVESTVDRIIDYIVTDCALKDKYRERIDSFFAFSDRNNCRRVYEAIINLRKRRETRGGAQSNGQKF